MTTPDEFEYDVAFSFAGEDRPLVREIGLMLEEAGVRVFYDDDQQALLWGSDLVETLDDVYQRRAFRVIMFVSAPYRAKAWPTHERRSALARQVEQPDEPYILPIRLDDTEIPGLRPTTHYLDARQLAPHEIVELALDSLAAAGWTPTDGLPSQLRREQAQRVAISGIVVEDGEEYRAEYTIINGSDYPINTVVVVVDDPGQPQHPTSQWGTAIEIVIGTIPALGSESGNVQVHMSAHPPFGALTRLVWVLFTDTWGQSWATNGTEFRRKAKPARIC